MSLAARLQPIAARLRPTAARASGLGVLSAGCSLGRSAISYFRPDWDSSPSFSKLLPFVKHIFKSLGWGAAFGVYQERTLTVFSPHTPPLQNVIACYTGAAGLASATREQLEGGKYCEYMDMAKPFGFLYAAAFVAEQIASQLKIPRIQVYRT